MGPAGHLKKLIRYFRVIDGREGKQSKEVDYRGLLDW